MGGGGGTPGGGSDASCCNTTGRGKGGGGGGIWGSVGGVWKALMRAVFDDTIFVCLDNTIFGTMVSMRGCRVRARDRIGS